VTDFVKQLACNPDIRELQTENNVGVRRLKDWFHYTAIGVSNLSPFLADYTAVFFVDFWVYIFLVLPAAKVPVNLGM
jgi:hypothetical protein